MDARSGFQKDILGAFDWPQINDCWSEIVVRAVLGDMETNAIAFV